MSYRAGTCMEFQTKIWDESGEPDFKEILNFLTFLQETFSPLLTQRDVEKSVKQPDTATKGTSLIKKQSPRQCGRIPDFKSTDEFPVLAAQTKKPSWYVVHNFVYTQCVYGHIHYTIFSLYVHDQNSSNALHVHTTER